MANSLNRRSSPSPTPAQQPLSKRDKKRHQVEQRIRDIEISFVKDRDYHLRNHLSSVNRDIHYVNRANPYANRPLEDFIDEPISDVVSQPSVAGSIDGENRAPPLGKFSQQYVDDVNDAMEERDARITETMNHFNTRIETLKIDLYFALETAEAEHRALVTAMRERMINQAEGKRRQLKKEKEMLDAADYSTLVNNGLTLIQPSSPGGLQTQRRTRNTRRQDADGADAADAGRRKRKAQGELGSDSPSHNGSRNRHDVQASALWDKQESSASSTSAVDVKIERYFTPRELNNHGRRAREEVATNWVNKTKPRPLTNPLGLRMNGDQNGDSAANGADDSDHMELDTHASLLIAPAMDRNGSSHATRSTRALYNFAETQAAYFTPPEIGQLASQPLSVEDAKKNYGSAVLAAQTQRSNLKETNKDIDVPFIQCMDTMQQDEDWHYIRNL